MEKKHYYTELHAMEIKPTAKHYATEKVCAHFSTAAEVGTVEFIIAQADAVKKIGGQQTSRAWTGYTIGATFVETHREEVTCMSPAYFEGHRSQPVFKQVCQYR